ncbi:coagulation factor X [Halyomorpha halys]|uniref:coagulation factor X n=1 Tax=Halyomorpha halys TaxID=286706 RepID=UPI0006D52361|nr:coagulation factor X-like [Halyomorpha halys]
MTGSTSVQSVRTKMSILLLLFFFSSGPHWINGYELGDCGIRYNNLPTHGAAVRQNEFPWHAALYRMDNSSQDYEYICGGTIVNTNAVLTAAHCVYDDEKDDIDYRKMVIAVGKRNSSWEHRDVHEQRFEVISKKLRITYRGFRTRFQDDIAILVLNDTIKFRSTVMPVCIDWGSLYEPNGGEVGTVFGWAVNNRGESSDEPKMFRMQQLNFIECYKKVSEDFSSFISSDKFCAIHKDNNTVEHEYVSGGLVFSRGQGDKERYFIKGVGSLKDRKRDDLIAFTNISSHIQWINRTLVG